MFHNLILLSRQPRILPSSVGEGCREELHPSLAPQAGLGSCSWGLSLQAVLAWSSSGTSEEIHMREPICCVHHRNWEGCRRSVRLSWSSLLCLSSLAAKVAEHRPHLCTKTAKTGCAYPVWSQKPPDAADLSTLFCNSLGNIFQSCDKTATWKQMCSLASIHLHSTP